MKNFDISPAFKDWVKNQTGLHISDNNRHVLTAAVNELSRINRCQAQDYVVRVQTGQLPLNPFIDRITTHESYFLRHYKTMDVVVKHLIPNWLNKQQIPSVLSCPAAQGEEPYSLAMLLNDVGISPGKVAITGIDISLDSIQRAKKASYQPYALRLLSDDFKQRHFSFADGVYKIRDPKLKQSVRFIQANVLDNFKSRFHKQFQLIFSQNLLIYFDLPTQQKMLEILIELLQADGWLFVDICEATLVSRYLNRVDIGHGLVGFQHRKASVTKPLPTAAIHLVNNKSINKTVVNSKTVPATRVKLAINKSTPQQNSIEDKLAYANACYNDKRFSEAIACYYQLIKSHPLKAAQSHLGIAQILIDQGEDMEAIEEAEMALQKGHGLMDIDKANAHGILSLILNKKGLKEAALEHRKEVEKLNPEHDILKIVADLKH